MKIDSERIATTFLVGSPSRSVCGRAAPTDNLPLWRLIADALPQTNLDPLNRQLALEVIATRHTIEVDVYFVRDSGIVCGVDTRFVPGYLRAVDGIAVRGMKIRHQYL